MKHTKLITERTRTKRGAGLNEISRHCFKFFTRNLYWHTTYVIKVSRKKFLRKYDANIVVENQSDIQTL